MKTELEIRQAANILQKHCKNAKKRDDLHAAAHAGYALSALVWALGDDDALAAAFEELIDGTREGLRRKAAQN